MESLGKRAQRDNDDDESSENSQENQGPYYDLKRRRHDSYDEEEDQIEDVNGQVDQQNNQLLTEEEIFWLQAQQEVLQEEEMFKNLSKEEIQRILEDKETEEVKIEKGSIRKMVKNIKERLNENQEKRIQFPKEPDNFLESEANLHSALKEIQFISALPQYADEFIKAEGVELMIEILDHQNPDVVVESITLLTELTDEDILNENPELRQTIKIMIQNEIWNFLARIIVKLNDNDEEERKILFSSFQLLENLLDQETELVSNKLMHIDTLIDWLLQFLLTVDIKSENFLQVAELMFTIVQNCSADYKIKFSVILNGMESLLSLLNEYRKNRKLELEEELEALANVFDTISSLLLAQENLDHFRKLQAFELLMHLAKKQKLFRRHIIKVLDYALAYSTQVNTKKNCKYFVEQGGLPFVFSFFMQKQEEQKKKKKPSEVYVKMTADEIQADEVHTLNILIGLLINSMADGKESGLVIHERVLFKFIENDFEKLQRLFELHLKYFQKLRDFDLTLFKEAEEIEYLVQDFGLEVVEKIDFVVGFLNQSSDARKLSEAELISNKITEFIKLNGLKKQSFIEIMRISQIRMNDEENPVMNSLINSIIESFQ